MTKSAADLLGQDAWHEERRKLRAILIGSGLEEAVKWNKLTYAYRGSNVAIIYGMAGTCALGFFKGSLLQDEDGDLVPPGEHSRAMRRLHFRNLEEIEAREDRIRHLIAEAIALEEQGKKVDFGAEGGEPEPPSELVEALGSDPALRQAFEELTPGRRRGYLLHFGGAKNSETRARRIETWRGAILQGKGLHDR